MIDLLKLFLENQVQVKLDELDAYAIIDKVNYSIYGTITDIFKIYETTPYSQEKHVNMKRKIKS